LCCGAAAGHCQAHVHALIHRDRLARPQLCPVHSVRRNIAAQRAPAPAHLHPIRQRRSRIARLRRASSRCRPHIKVNSSVPGPVSGLGIRRACVQCVADHHSRRRIARPALQAHHPRYHRSVSRQRLIHEVKAIRCSKDLRSCSVYRERSICGCCAPCQAHRADILIQPSTRQWL
jgi:hypothetical protein